jgi:large subunit ribosomal protein L19
MSNRIQSSPVVQSQLKDIPTFTTGSVVKVSYIIKENNKERVQAFEGIVIARNNGKSTDASFTVLKNATGGIKVTRIFPLHSPLILKIEVLSLQRGRQSKLYYLNEVKDPIKSIRSKKVKTKEV